MKDSHQLDTTPDLSNAAATPSRERSRVVARAAALAWLVVASIGTATVDSAQCGLLQKLTPSDGVTGDMFGYAVGITGGTIAVGAPFHPANVSTSSNYAAGAAYVFERGTGSSAGTWLQLTKLVAPTGDSNAFDAFGTAISIHQSLLAVGAPQDDGATPNSNVGAVYVYLKTANVWNLETKLTPPSGDPIKDFGRAVSLWDDTLAIGADSTDTDGKVYVYRRLGSTWTLEATLAPSVGPLFGWSVSLFQDVLAVGAPGAASGGVSQSGLACAFERQSSGWSLTQTLTNPAPNGFDQFGAAVTTYGRSLAVGTPFDTISGVVTTGAAYVFTKSNGQYSLSQTLTSTPSPAGQHFGNALAMTNGQLVVGAEVAYSEQGRAYRFVAPQSSLWGQVAEYADPDSSDQPWFGSSVAVSDYAVVGARRDDQVAVDTGAAFVFCIQ